MMIYWIVIVLLFLIWGSWTIVSALCSLRNIRKEFELTRENHERIDE